MDYTLPETLQSIIETIGSKNLLKGYKIYSEGGKTNIVIQFVEYQVQPCSPNLQSCTSECQVNEQLKPAMCPPRHRSTSNRARDLRRVQCHNTGRQNEQLFCDGKSMDSPKHMDLGNASKQKYEQKSDEDVLKSLSNNVFSPDSGMNETVSHGSIINAANFHDDECSLKENTDIESESCDHDVSEPSTCKQFNAPDDRPPWANELLAMSKAVFANVISVQSNDDDDTDDSTAQHDGQRYDSVT